MIICSALYYAGSLNDPMSLVRDNRFYAGKAIETLPVWWSYLRKHYPDARVTLFADRSSPVRINAPLWETMVTNPHAPTEVVWTDQFAGQYFRPMQRNLVEAINLAYRLNQDLFWLDNDAFLNTDIRPLVRGADCAAPSIAHHQQTMDSVCTYVSARRLHALDDLNIDLPSFLTTMLNEGPTETRMHTLQEGGLYKLFAYGDARQLGARIELSHLSCYDHFVAFLKRNPLDTPEWRALAAGLEAVDWSRMPGVERAFLDMDYGSHNR